MTKAIRAHGTLLQMGDGGVAGTPKTVSGTAHDDAVKLTLVTCSTAHGFVDGQPVTIAGVTGTGATGANGTWPIKRVSSMAFTIPVKTTGDGAGAATATPLAESFTTVAEVGDIKGPNLTREDLDVTSHDSPDDYEELIATIKRSGEISAPIHWVPDDPTHDSTTGLYAAYEDGVTRSWKLVLTDDDSDPSYLQVSGFVNELSPAMPVAGALTADIKIKVLGAPIFHITGA